MQTLSLYSAQSADGASNKCKAIDLGSGVANKLRVLLHVRGTFGSGTVKLQGSLDNVNYDNIQVIKDDGTLVDVVITSNAFIAIDILTGAYFGLDLSGSTSPNLNADIHGDIETA